MRPGPAGDVVRLVLGSGGDRGGRGGARGPGGGSPGREGVAPRGPLAFTLPLGLQAAQCWLRGPAPPPIRLLQLGACSRRLRCQQTTGASLPGPPLSNSGSVSGRVPRRTRAVVAQGSGALQGLLFGSRSRLPWEEGAGGRAPGLGGEHCLSCCPWPLGGPLV